MERDQQIDGAAAAEHLARVVGNLRCAGNAACAPIERSAQILDEDGTRRARAATVRKYGTPGRLLVWARLLRCGVKGVGSAAIDWRSEFAPRPRVFFDWVGVAALAWPCR